MEIKQLVNLSFVRTDEKIEVYPGLFVNVTKLNVELTESGKYYLSDLASLFKSNQIDEIKVMTCINNISKQQASGYWHEVSDKLWCELLKLI